jgi:hypothetical protein
MSNDGQARDREISRMVAGLSQLSPSDEQAILFLGAGWWYVARDLLPEPLAWIHRNVFAPCAVLAGRKPLAVAGHRIQKVHDLSSRNGPPTRATSSLDRYTTTPSMAQHRSDDGSRPQTERRPQCAHPPTGRLLRAVI